MKEFLLNRFLNIYGNSTDVRIYFAPGRVNLIGEHTDYNGGYVFPCSLTIGTYAAVRLREDNIVRLYSDNFPGTGTIEIQADKPEYDKADNWANYPKGVIWSLAQNGFMVNKGFDILYYGNIPNGAGLSSSASIEVLTGYVIRELFGYDYSMTDNAIMCRFAENKYIGMNCGIMDQFAVAMGKKNCAVYLNTGTLEYEYVPLELGDCKIVIMNTNKQRGLCDSQYNERKNECDRALQALKNVADINNLCDLSPEQFGRYSHVITDELLLKRARHAVYENYRTRAAVEALRHNDLTGFGRLMKESHISLRDDYDVTGIELDTLVEAAWQCEGTVGARMTGAGFGGCAIALVKEKSIEAFVEKVGKEYSDKTGLRADFYVVETGDGPCII